jgi:hypothetical protein
MNRNRSIASLIAAAAGAGVIALAAGFGQPEGQPEMELPPGWTMDDMMACMQAGTPGEQHAWLAETAGTWSGSGKMWMGPGGEAIDFDGEMTVTPIMDGRYIRTEMSSDIPGMGPYTGEGVAGYDNVAGRYTSNWFDNHSTGIMQGTGKKSADGTITWEFKYMCPINRKPTTLREVQKFDGDSLSMEMHAIDPKSGKEYTMMTFDYTRR